MTKPVLILQLRPEDETSDNEYAAFLKYGQLDADETCRMRIEKQGIPEDLLLDDYCGIIVGGSPFDISTPADKKSAIQKQIEKDFDRLLKQVVAKDFPFLGACSGNGLLGSFLGAPITTRYSEPVSCASVTVTEEGKQDPLLSGFPDRINVLLGHKEACDVTPKGVTLLIKGDNCPVQMFRIGKNVYATQFHPEGDVEGFVLRIQVYKHHGYFQPHEAEELIVSLSGTQTPYAQEILRRFVGLAQANSRDESRF